MASLLLWILSWFAVPVTTERVAVEAAYTLHTATIEPVAKKCCGACKGGVIVHGDGHRTPCPCPADCECKRAGEPPAPPATPAAQPPAKPKTYRPMSSPCVNGKCERQT